ncbi:MAG TPA: hypothetical protein VKW04_22410 [Planctomycetota bacterium]|nr:hypothetical protein [Planctomycetota bacterium]
MDEARILLVVPDAGLPAGFPSAALLERDSSLIAETTRSIQEALTRLSAGGYSALVCWAERQDELAGLIRIRKGTPALPILLLTSERDVAFQSLARQLGATRVLNPDPDPTRTADLIRTAVTSGELVRELRERLTKTRTQTKDLLDLVKENRDLTELARVALRREPRLSFIPLVIEGDPGRAFQITRALQQADVFAPLPILRGRDEAVAFLTTLATPAVEGIRILPSILLLDGDLPANGAFELLHWVRSHARYSRLPVILLGSSPEFSQISRAYEHRANSYLLKPSDFEAQVHQLQILKSYWGTFNQGPVPY